MYDKKQFSELIEHLRKYPFTWIESVDWVLLTENELKDKIRKKLLPKNSPPIEFNPVVTERLHEISDSKAAKPLLKFLSELYFHAHDKKEAFEYFDCSGSTDLN